MTYTVEQLERMLVKCSGQKDRAAAITQMLAELRGPAVEEEKPSAQDVLDAAKQLLADK